MGKRCIVIELLGAVSLSEAESRSVLDERALVCGRHIFGWYFPFRVAQLRDARARGGKLRSLPWFATHVHRSVFSCISHLSRQAVYGMLNVAYLRR
jgi:hypothetical protein